MPTANTRRTLATLYARLGYSPHEAVEAEMAASDRTIEERMRALEVEGRVRALLIEPEDPTAGDAR